MKYQYTSLEELPPFLNADQIAAVLGISRASTYSLLHTRGFPTVMVGKRMIVEKAKLLKWIEERIEK